MNGRNGFASRHARTHGLERLSVAPFLFLVLALDIR